MNTTQATTSDSFLADVLHGMVLPQKALPSKYLYDERSSQLFDLICETDEYYPTRAELENRLPSTMNPPDTACICPQPTFRRSWSAVVSTWSL